MKRNEILLFYVTHQSHQDASDFIHQLIERKLIACGNIFPIHSCFGWQGSYENTDEYVSISKTLPSMEKDVASFMQKIHTYDTPCLIRWTVRVNMSFASWVASQLTANHES